MRSFTNEHQSDWDEWTKFYEFSYNTTPHTDHNFTPFELVFGKKATLPHDTIQNNNEPIYNYDSYKSELKFKLKKSHEIAKQTLLEQKKNEERNNSITISILFLLKLTT